MKSPEFSKKAAQILESGAREGLKSNSSSCFGIRLHVLKKNGVIIRIKLERASQLDPGEASSLFEQYLEEKSFAHLLSPLPLTPFSKAVLKELCNTPFGETISYSRLAERIGRPTARRAVAMALHHNPIPLFIPCHRVIAKDGSLGGFAYGLPMKKEILDFEREHLTKKDS